MFNNTLHIQNAKFNLHTWRWVILDEELTLPHRVPWLKKLSAGDLNQFLSVDRFINPKGWIANLPTIV